MSSIIQLFLKKEQGGHSYGRTDEYYAGTDATQALYEEIASKFNIEVSFVAHVFMLSISYYLVY